MEKTEKLDLLFRQFGAELGTTADQFQQAGKCDPALVASTAKQGKKTLIVALALALVVLAGGGAKTVVGQFQKSRIESTVAGEFEEKAASLKTRADSLRDKIKTLAALEKQPESNYRLDAALPQWRGVLDVERFAPLKSDSTPDQYGAALRGQLAELERADRQMATIGQQIDQRIAMATQAAKQREIAAKAAAVASAPAAATPAPAAPEPDFSDIK